mgnify:CR=1 FL=1
MSSARSLIAQTVDFSASSQRRGNRWERGIEVGLALAGAVPILILLAIIATFAYESWLFFQQISPWQFLTDTGWSPLFTSRQFGVIVLVSATLMVSTIAMAFAIPVGLLSAIYLEEYAPPPVRRLLKPTVESLAGVPTIIYGYFALLVVTPFLQNIWPGLSFFNSLSAGLVTGILITPIVTAFSEDALHSVPDTLRQGAYACGLTRQEMVMRVLLPAASPGIIASFTLAASRALGETMIAAIAAGQTPKLTLNPLVPVETMTTFIVKISLGDVRTDSLIFHTIFAVGGVLFLITLILNSIGNWLVRRFQNTTEAQFMPSTKVQEDLSYAQGSLPLPCSPFKSNLPWRQGIDRIFSVLGLGAALIGPLFFATLMGITLRVGFSHLNWQFLTSYTSSDPARSGILAALAGTSWLLGLTALFAVPIGIAAAIFLEEYLPVGVWSRLIDINLQNATAIPGILYGLLGLTLFARVLQPVTGGRTLLAAALMMTTLVLPMLITSVRTVLRRLPTALKKGGYAVGMSRWQVIWHLILPAALPDMFTGLLLSLSRVLGETSPLIAIGAVQFVTFTPSPSLEGLQSSFTTLTTQIFFWLSRPQVTYQEKASAAVLLLGGMLLVVSILAGIVRDGLRSMCKSRLQ